MQYLKSLVSGLVLLLAGAANAQTVLQSGPFVQGHAAMYQGFGTGQAVVSDSGPAGGGGFGVGLSELGLTINTPNLIPPYADAGTGVFNTNFCDYDAQVTNSTGYHFLCFSPNALGGGLIAYGAAGGATALPFQLNINGVLSTIPSSGFGTITGVTAGTGLTGGGTVGDVTLGLNVIGGSSLLGNPTGSIGVPSSVTLGTGLAFSGSDIVVSDQVAAGGPIGSSTAIPVITYNAQGQLTAVSTANPTVDAVNGVAFGSSPTTNTVPVVTGVNTTTYEAVPNAALAHSATTVNGQSCVLGAACTVTAGASDLTVGTTTITGGSSGKVEYNNSGVLGEYSVSGSGSVAMTTSPTFVTPTLGAATATSVNRVAVTTPATGATLALADNSSLVTVGAFTNTLTFTGATNVTFPTSGTLATTAGTIATASNLAGGVANDIPYQTGTGATGFVSPVNSAVLVTDGSGVPSESTTLPSGLSATNLALTTPILGTPQSGVMTNVTGTASGLTAGHVTTNADLTGVITSSGNATSIASQTGTGTKFVVDTSPVLVTPDIGVATATSVNRVAVTAPATGATLALADNSTLATSGAYTTTITATGPTGITVPTSGTVLSSVIAPAANPVTGTPSSSNFLRGDGTWATPAGGGNVSGPGSSTSGYFPVWNNTSGTLLAAGIAGPTSGTLLSSTTAPAANPITGTPSSSTYLRGDGTWSAVTTTPGVHVVSSGASYGVLAADTFVVVTKVSGSATSLTLPVSPATGETHTIKDGKGDGATNNITISGSQNIDGAANFIIRTNWGSINLVYDGTYWDVY